MKILVKFPSRHRPSQFTWALNKAIENQTTNLVHYLVTFDDDDPSMNKLREMLPSFKYITLIDGKSASKIHACNRGLNQYNGDWDIVVLMSDDMICQQKGWDKILIDEMQEHFPDTDGVLWHSDGYVREKLNTMCILGRKYYDRFGYIYNPEYKSFWCDNEFMEVANKLGRQKYFDNVLFKHEHPANTGDQMDSLYLTANNDYQRDKKVFDKRKANNYGIKETINA